MIYKSKSVNKINCLKKFDNGVIIFGTGNLGTLALRALEKKNIKVVCFLDTNKENQNKNFKNYKVISLKDLSADLQSLPIIISGLHFRYYKRILKSLNISNYYDADFLFNELDLSNMDTAWTQERCKIQLDLYNFSVKSSRESKKLNLNSLDIVLTEKCSLKCKDCSNLMQYYAKPVDEDFNTLVDSLDKFMKAVDYVQELRIIGGEPFMYKKINEVLKIITGYKNFGNLLVYTNGTIVPKEDKISSFKGDNVVFKISNYGSISRNVKKLEEFLKKNEINYITENVTKWQDCAKIQKYERDLSLTKEIFGNCLVNDALTLLHGNLYLCPYSAHGENLNAFPKEKNDSINLLANFDTATFKEKIRSLVFDKEYLKACNWCNGRDHNVAKIDAAIQTKKPLDYKKYI